MTDREVARRTRQLDPSTKRTIIACVAVVLLVSLIYVFFGSTGTFHQERWPDDYYDRICEGFRAGHLYIKELPSRALLSKADPYDRRWTRLGLWDASLYGGHYYLYWGPVPALFMLAFKTLTGSHEVITDQWPTVIFMVGRLCAGAALLVSIATRPKQRQPTWICALAIAVFGLANPLPYIVARPWVYEASLTGAQCFAFWGLLFAFWGMELPGFRRRLFVAASIAWALAIGCRVTSFVSVPLAMLATLVLSSHRTNRSWKTLLADALALGVPVAFAIGAYAWYNYARFHSPSEFGVSYMITLQPFAGKKAYIIPNVFSYLFAPVVWSCHFPFVRIITFRPLSSLIHWPAGYQVFEKAGGIMLTAKWCWLTVLCVVRLVAYIRQRLSVSGLPSLARFSRAEAWGLWCSLSLVASMGPVLILWEASMRYAGDAVGGIVLAATIGAFGLFRWTIRERRRVFGALARVLVLALGLQTCVVGALAAFTTSDEPIRTQNPRLYHRLEKSLSLCESPDVTRR
ncbi:MAG TPA: hypothetical protein VHV51_24850 [Polyangiaceae bacterium]|nr:hypothetical protein [Polyangiaceae bacterium]